MGKFQITVSGTDQKSEIISETYHVRNCNEEVKTACRELFEEQWSCYEPHNIEIEVIDIEKLYANFKVDEKVERQIQHKIYNNKRGCKYCNGNGYIVIHGREDTPETCPYCGGTVKHKSI